MESSILELLHKVTVVDLIWTLVLITTLVAVLLSQKKRIMKALNKWRKIQNEEDDFKASVDELKSTVEKLVIAVEEFKQNRIRDREDSRKIQKEIYQAIAVQADGIKELKNINLERQKIDSKTKRAEIKRSIERIYAECHPAMACTEMQYEVLQDLIEEYEEHGGMNSFVHSTVEPEMVCWKKIEAISTK